MKPCWPARQFRAQSERDMMISMSTSIECTAMLACHDDHLRMMCRMQQIHMATAQLDGVRPVAYQGIWRLQKLDDKPDHAHRCG